MIDNYSWEVTSQANEQQIDATGNLVTGKNVTFTIMPTGYTGTLFIPDVIYANTDAAREAIQREVDAVVAVHNLTG